MRLLVAYFLLVTTIAVAGAMFGQESDKPESADQAIGLARLPEVSERVFVRPSRDSEVLGVIEVRRHDGIGSPSFRRMNSAGDLESGSTLQTQELDRDHSALIVYERNGDWLRIELDGRTGWVERSKTAGRTYPELMAGKISY